MYYRAQWYQGSPSDAPYPSISPAILAVDLGIRRRFTAMDETGEIHVWAPACAGSLGDILDDIKSAVRWLLLAPSKALVIGVPGYASLSHMYAWQMLSMHDCLIDWNADHCVGQPDAGTPYNIPLFLLNEAFTSLTCSRCSTVAPPTSFNPIFRCPSCEHTMDRDANAASNLLASFLRLVPNALDLDRVGWHALANRSEVPWHETPLKRLYHTWRQDRAA